MFIYIFISIFNNIDIDFTLYNLLNMFIENSFELSDFINKIFSFEYSKANLSTPASSSLPEGGSSPNPEDSPNNMVLTNQDRSSNDDSDNNYDSDSNNDSDSSMENMNEESVGGDEEFIDRIDGNELSQDISDLNRDSQRLLDEANTVVATGENINEDLEDRITQHLFECRDAIVNYNRSNNSSSLPILNENLTEQLENILPKND